MTKGVPPQAGSGHSPKGGAASSTASPAQPSVPNAAFTPGPWGYEPLNGDWRITYGPGLHHGPLSLANVFDYAGEFQEADARLIATAPELCEALGDALPALEAAKEYADFEWECRGPKSSNPVRVSLLRDVDVANARLVRAKAILAKVRGQ